LKRKNIRYHRGYEKEKKVVKMYSLEKAWEEVQVDTWYPFGYHRKFVIYSAIDDCMRMTYSKAYGNANLENSKDFMDEIVRRYPFDIKRVRTDQGREFSMTISEYLRGKGIEHVKNEAYHPEHNGKIERYHLTEKEWEVQSRPYLIELEEANYMLSQRLGYYNEKRRHTCLWMNGKTPREKYIEQKSKKRT
jgi:transposase InsO family protein